MIPINPNLHSEAHLYDIFADVVPTKLLDSADLSGLAKVLRSDSVVQWCKSKKN